ncbi:hypothetical protein [Cellulomonas sp. P5_C5]
MTPELLVRTFVDVVRSGDAPERAAEFMATTVTAPRSLEPKPS